MISKYDVLIGQWRGGGMDLDFEDLAEKFIKHPDRYFVEKDVQRSAEMELLKTQDFLPERLV
jgi:hypothetical protein